jgi:hypothetical protein
LTASINVNIGFARIGERLSDNARPLRLEQSSMCWRAAPNH